MKPIIILVHGLKASSVIFGKDGGCKTAETLVNSKNLPEGSVTEFSKLPQWLNEEGYEVYFFFYDSNKKKADSVEKAADLLSKHISEFIKSRDKETKVVIIANSFGGLVTRVYIDSKRYDHDKAAIKQDYIAGAIFVGVPNTMVGHTNILAVARLLNNKRHKPALWDLDTKNIADFNKKYCHTNENIPYLLIGGKGRSTLLGYICHTWLYLKHGPNDCIIPLESATKLENAVNIKKLVVEEAHWHLFGDYYYDCKKDGSKSATYIQGIKPFLDKLPKRGG